MAQLTRLVREQKFDVVHGYEWPPGVEAALGPGLRLGAPVLCTVYSMAVAPFLPHTLPLLVSTDNIRIRAEKAGFAQVTLRRAAGGRAGQRAGLQPRVVPRRLRPR